MEVSEETLRYWANYKVGGSGMGIGMQEMIKQMAREILEHRGLPLEETDGVCATSTPE